MTTTYKSHEDFFEQEPSYAANLEIFDKKINANKFWRVKVFGLFVIRHWGRHGSKGQYKVEKFSLKKTARAKAESLVEKKRDKGYRKEAGVLDKLAREIE